MYPDGRNELAAHIVVTSYEAPIDDRQFFNKIKWAGMIVDEGQRLKNDKNLLYHALLDMKIPFRVLLTGKQHDFSISGLSINIVSRYPGSEQQA